jgi:hypothetical protein
VNFVVDGGDNNDDTIGGLTQLFPLEGIQQFNVMTQRFDAQYGRGASVLNVVTKSGTNDIRGSGFTMFRDTSMNAKTESEQLNHMPKQDYRRYQYGGSIGGPIATNRLFYFAALERDAAGHQADGQHAGPLSVRRWGVRNSCTREPVHRQSNREPARRSLLRRPLRVRRQLIAEAARDRARRIRRGPRAPTPFTRSMSATAGCRRHQAERLIFQVSTFDNEIPGSTTQPVLMFPNGVTGGANASAPQTTEQTKWQLRDDVSWSAHRFGGLEHNLKAGGNWLHEPRLFISAQSGLAGFFTMGANDLNAPVQTVQVIGGTVEVNIPLDFYSAYIQDDWRATSRLTFNLGVAMTTYQACRSTRAGIRTSR